MIFKFQIPKVAKIVEVKSSNVPAVPKIPNIVLPTPGKKNPNSTPVSVPVSVPVTVSKPVVINNNPPQTEKNEEEVPKEEPVKETKLDFFSQLKMVQLKKTQK